MTLYFNRVHNYSQDCSLPYGPIERISRGLSRGLLAAALGRLTGFSLVVFASMFGMDCCCFKERTVVLDAFNILVCAEFWYVG